MSQDQALPPRRSVPGYPSCQNPAHKGSLHSQVAQREEGAHSYRENLTQAGSPSTGRRNPSLPANSCRRARAKALPTTCAPITMIWARYLACGQRRHLVSGLHSQGPGDESWRCWPSGKAVGRLRRGTPARRPQATSSQRLIQDSALGGIGGSQESSLEFWGAGTRKSPPEGDGALSQPSDKADRSEGNVAWEPELGVGPGLTASSASELGGSSLHLLVVRCRAILILPTLFKSIPFNTTREQNALHPRPPFLHWLTASLKPRLSQCQGIRHTGPSPAGIPPLPPWGIKQDQRCTRSTEGGEPSGRTWGLWGVRALLPGK